MLMKPGYWADTYWADWYWADDYWGDYSSSAVIDPSNLIPGYYAENYWVRGYFNNLYWAHHGTAVVEAPTMHPRRKKRYIDVRREWLLREDEEIIILL